MVQKNYIAFMCRFFVRIRLLLIKKARRLGSIFILFHIKEKHFE